MYAIRSYYEHAGDGEQDQRQVLQGRPFQLRPLPGVQGARAGQGARHPVPRPGGDGAGGDRRRAVEKSRPPVSRITSYNVCYTKLLRGLAEKGDRHFIIEHGVLTEK